MVTNQQQINRFYELGKKELGKYDFESAAATALKYGVDLNSLTESRGAEFKIIKDRATNDNLVAVNKDSLYQSAQGDDTIRSIVSKITSTAGTGGGVLDTLSAAIVSTSKDTLSFLSKLGAGIDSLFNVKSEAKKVISPSATIVEGSPGAVVSESLKGIFSNIEDRAQARTAQDNIDEALKTIPGRLTKPFEMFKPKRRYVIVADKKTDTIHLLDMQNKSIVFSDTIGHGIENDKYAKNKPDMTFDSILPELNFGLFSFLKGRDPSTGGTSTATGYSDAKFRRTEDWAPGFTQGIAFKTVFYPNDKRRSVISQAIHSFDSSTSYGRVEKAQGEDYDVQNVRPFTSGCITVANRTLQKILPVVAGQGDRIQCYILPS